VSTGEETTIWLKDERVSGLHHVELVRTTYDTAVEIAVGNVLGSNVFNTFAVMGVPSLIAPVAVPESVRMYALPVMVLATLLYYFITQDRELTVWEGVVLLVLYAAFLVNLGTVT